MAAYSKELIIFDLDGTLAPSKSPMDKEMGDLLMQLLARKKVAVISGGAFPQFQIQFLHALPAVSDNLSNLLIMPTSGGQLYVWRGTWTQQYAEHLTPAEKEKIMTTLNV